MLLRSDVLDRLLEALLSELPADDDKQLLKHLVEQFRKGGKAQVQEQVRIMIDGFRGT